MLPDPAHPHYQAERLTCTYIPSPLRSLTRSSSQLFEENRMDKAGPFAQAMGLDTQDNSFWRDQAFLELNRAGVSSRKRNFSATTP